MTTRLELRQQIQRLLGDPTAVIFSADLLNDGINEALDEILPWVYKAVSVDLTGDAETYSFQLPTDFYRVVGILAEDEAIWVPQETFVAGQSRVAGREINNNWMLFPEGYITFANALADGEIYALHYGALWPKLTTDPAVLATPSWVKLGLVYFAASYALIKEATNAANVRQWNTDMDSGTPVMNPMADMSDKLLRKFVDHMSLHISKTKGAQ